MEMTYDGALVMPSSYALMDEDEMMYLDGGYTFSMKRSTATLLIDITAIILTAGLASTATVANIAAKIGWTAFKTKAISAMTKLGVTIALAKAGWEIIKLVSGLSIGSALSWVLDKVDKSGLNGYIQF